MPLLFYQELQFSNDIYPKKIYKTLRGEIINMQSSTPINDFKDSKIYYQRFIDKNGKTIKEIDIVNVTEVWSLKKGESVEGFLKSFYSKSFNKGKQFLGLGLWRRTIDGDGLWDESIENVKKQMQSLNTIVEPDSFMRFLAASQDVCHNKHNYDFINLRDKIIINLDNKIKINNNDIIRLEQ